MLSVQKQSMYSVLQLRKIGQTNLRLSEFIKRSLYCGGKFMILLSAPLTDDRAQGFRRIVKPNSSFILSTKNYAQLPVRPFRALIEFGNLL